MIDQIWSISSTPTVGVNGARNAELIFATMVKKSADSDFDGVAQKSRSPAHHYPGRHTYTNHTEASLSWPSLSPILRAECR